MEATGAVTAALPVPTQLKCVHTPSLAFRHLPLYTARIGYATEDALFNSAQLSTDGVCAHRKVWVLISLCMWKQPSVEA